MQSAQSANTNKIKKDAIEILNKSGPLSTSFPYAKSSHGFNHIDTGHLLCPASLADEYDEE
jgi:hypothetical protein